MPSVYCWNEKCVTWNSSIAGFAIWFFMLAAMSLVGVINFYAAETSNIVTTPNTGVTDDNCSEKDKRLATGSPSMHCGKAQESVGVLMQNHDKKACLIPKWTAFVGMNRDASQIYIAF